MSYRRARGSHKAQRPLVQSQQAYANPCEAMAAKYVCRMQASRQKGMLVHGTPLLVHAPTPAVATGLPKMTGAQLPVATKAHAAHSMARHTA